MLHREQQCVLAAKERCGDASVESPSSTRELTGDSLSDIYLEEEEEGGQRV